MWSDNFPILNKSSAPLINVINEGFNKLINVWNLGETAPSAGILEIKHDDVPVHSDFIYYGSSL